MQRGSSPRPSPQHKPPIIPRNHPKGSPLPPRVSGCSPVKRAPSALMKTPPSTPKRDILEVVPNVIQDIVVSEDEEKIKKVAGMI